MCHYFLSDTAAKSEAVEWHMLGWIKWPMLELPNTTAIKLLFNRFSQIMARTDTWIPPSDPSSPLCCEQQAHSGDEVSSSPEMMGKDQRF